MEAGKLKHYITLQNKNVSTVGTRGQVGDEWETVFEGIPAEVTTLSGREAEIARQMVASADTRIRLRFISNVTTASRFTWNDRTFNVVWINNTNQQNYELVCLCQGVA